MKTYEERTQAVEKKLHRRRTQLRWTAATAGMLCLCILVGIALPHFENEPDNGKTDILMNNKTEENVGDYAKVIRVIRAYEEKYQSDYVDGIPEDAPIFGEVVEDMPVAPGAPLPEINSQPSKGENQNSSVEITDHQVAGVLEADIIKRSQTHIFYLHNNKLDVYPIAGIDTQLLSSMEIGIDEGVYYGDAMMYLSADAARLNVIVSGWVRGPVAVGWDSIDSFVKVISLDVSDPANIREQKCMIFTGSYTTSRMIGDNILLISNFTMDAQVDFEDESTFLPQYGTPGQMESISASCIVVPEELTDKDYTVVTLLDGKNMTVLGSGAFMSYSNQLYVSAENIYATRTYTETVDLSEKHAKNVNMTEISCMAYSEETLTLNGTFTVEGWVKNQYSMDEHNGIFRVVTTTRSNDVEKIHGGYQALTVNPTNANLTCFKVGTWEQVAQVAQFAPDGETVESVRFDGDYAYVCTAKVVTLTDPVFFFDLSDLNNITYKDTGVIEGYSSSLIQLKDGYLLGIGFGEDRNFKVEIYEETADGVNSVCSYSRETFFSSEYKSYYIDRENALFGIPTGDGYVLLTFDGCQLIELTIAPVWADGDTRGVIIDDCLYVFARENFFVQEIIQM